MLINSNAVTTLWVFIAGHGMKISGPIHSDNRLSRIHGEFVHVSKAYR